MAEPGAVLALRHPNRKLQVDEVRALIEAYRAGETIAGLARRFGMNHATVRAHLRRNQVEFRKQALTSEDRAEIERQYLAGATILELSQAFGVGLATIHRSLQRSGTPRRGRGRPRSGS